jgi:hypothetical protein
MMPSQLKHPPVEHQIAVWGPTGSGKTWLIKAFGRELNYYQQNDPYFHYRLEQQNGTPIILTPPEARPTEKGDDWLWRFQRVAKDNDAGRRMSSFSHDITIHDDKGSTWLEVTDSPGQQPLAEMTLLTFPYLLVLLDPTLVQGKIIEQRRYIQLIQDLCIKLQTQTQAGERYMAVCITKNDLTGLRRSDAWPFVAAFFGADMVNLLKTYSHYINIEAFVTSAAGYFNGKANYDTATGLLMHPDQWSPHNIAAPFFWLFEKDERHRLGSSREGLYVPYPPIRR